MEELKYRREDEMKDSGIEWLGMIPKEWGVSTLGKVSLIQTGNTPSMQGEENYYENGEVLWVKPDNLNSFNPIDDTKEKINNLGVSKARIVPPNTPLVCCIGSIGKFGYSQQSVAYNQQINSVRFDENKINWKYGLYYLSTQEAQHWYYSTGNVVSILNSQNQKQIVIPMISLIEQQKIASFLDYKTSQFDSIISKKEKLIEKLEEVKKSLISEIVTGKIKIEDGQMVERKPEEMKDSGIEWLGMIPKDWEVKKLKTLFFENKVKNDRGIETNVLSLSYGNIIKRDVESNFGLLPASFNTYQIVDHGYLILRLTDLQNDKRSLRVGLAKERGIITSAYLALVSKNEVSPSFMYYLFHSYDLHKVFYNMGGGLRQSMTFKDAKELPVLYPTELEQQNIANYIDKKIVNFNVTIKKTKTQIQKLKEAKQSLISEAVSGKIDLRDWEIREVDDL